MLFLITFFFSVLSEFFVGIYHHSVDELHVLLQGLEFPDSNKNAPGLSLHDPPVHFIFFSFPKAGVVPDSHDGGSYMWFGPSFGDSLV